MPIRPLRYVSPGFDDAPFKIECEYDRKINVLSTVSGCVVKRALVFARVCRPFLFRAIMYYCIVSLT